MPLALLPVPLARCMQAADAGALASPTAQRLQLGLMGFSSGGWEISEREISAEVQSITRGPFLFYPSTPSPSLLPGKLRRPGICLHKARGFLALQQLLHSPLDHII